MEPVASCVEGVKHLRVRETPQGLAFAGVFERAGGGTYGNDADAVCEEGVEHDAPGRWCRCGFHAVATESELWRVGEVRGTHVADVQLAGRVIEHEHGWRGAWQRVVQVRVAARCAWCGADTTGIARRRRSAELVASCGRCGSGVRSLQEAGAELGCSVIVDAAWRPTGEREMRAARTWCWGGGAAVLLAGVVLGVVTGQMVLVNVAGMLCVPWGAVAQWRTEGVLARRELSREAMSRARSKVRSDVLWLGMLGWVAAGAVGVVLGG